MSSFLHLAVQPSIRRRAIRVALIVGSVFFAINYGDKLIAGTLTGLDVFKAMISYCVPYCVSTYSSVQALRDRDAV